MLENLKKYPADILSIIVAVSFGTLTHASFVTEDFLIVVSFSLLFLLPIGIGALAVWFLTKLAGPELTWTRALLRPWVPCVLFMLVLLIFQWEATICLILASPLVFFLASVGGGIMYALHISMDEVTNAALLVFLVAPFALSPIEDRFETPERLSETRTSIHIEASPAEVWAQIGNVPEFTADEHRPNFFHTVGVPRPIGAQMGEIRPGAVRIATFEDGMVFREVVTEMELERSVTYSIDALGRELLPSPVNQIDGEYLDVKSARYEIESLDDGTVMLHLIGTHTLSTQFNLYGSIWTKLILADFQTYILDVIKLRAEAV